jgi:hypothetical protein
MTIHIKSTVRNDMLAALNVAANAGSGAATIELRSGTQPANADAADVGTVLATFTCADPAFETPASGSMDVDANPDLTATASATGTASWARMKDSNGVVVFDGSVGTSGADYTITSTSIVSGQTVTLTVGALTLPA